MGRRLFQWSRKKTCGGVSLIGKDQICDIFWKWDNRIKIINKQSESKKSVKNTLRFFCFPSVITRKVAIAAAAKLLQSSLTLCNPIDGCPPGSPVPGILQERPLEWVAISFSNAWKWKVKGKMLSRIRLLATPWTAAHQAPPSIGFSRQEYWSELPLPSPIVFFWGSNYTH